MGTIINLAQAPARAAGNGATEATLVGDSRQIAAALLRLPHEARYVGEVPRGSDQYLFVLAGAAGFEGPGPTKTTMGRRGFALVEEGKSFTLTGSGPGEAQVLSVTVPPAGGGAGVTGFSGGCKVTAADSLPVLDVPEQKKRRIFLATHDTVGSERGHAMIVEYVADTVTPRHHHPNAESMFVLLDGRLRFLVNGEEHILGPGQATHFPMSDSHALRSADGQPLNFLEFHVPGVFRTNFDG
jgi:mannose-6-phosphate isomerase-like protein (cupin superfamily)